jgi:hypothetical protein
MKGQLQKDFLKWSKGKGLTNHKAKNYSLDVATSMYYSIMQLFYNSIGIYMEVSCFLNSDDELKFYWGFVNEKTVKDKKGNDEFETITEAMVKTLAEAEKLYYEKNPVRPTFPEDRNTRHQEG